MKKLLFLICMSLCSFAFASGFKIKRAEYRIKGITRKYALETKVKLNKDKIFKTEDELIEYIEDYKSRLNNLRAFEKVTVDFTVSETASEEDVFDVTLNVITEDSHHLLVVPYPKYSTNGGFTLKIKALDSNFLGSLETMGSEINFKNDGDTKIGLKFDYDMPFKFGIFDALWKNTVGAEYEFGQSSPSWDITTGLQLRKDFKRISFVNIFSQGSTRHVNQDILDSNGKTVTIDNLTNFTESYMFSAPIVVQDIDNWGKIFYTPSAAFTYLWTYQDLDDAIGSNDAMTDDVRESLKESIEDSLLTYGVLLSQSISTSRINWIENFRDGFGATLSQTYLYSFSTNSFTTGVNAEILMYKALELPVFDKKINFGINANIYAFANMKGYSNFGSRLRGIDADQNFDIDVYKDVSMIGSKPCVSNAGIIINLDVPIKIWRFYWEKVPVINKIKKSSYLNMELQISPFVDFALYHNKATGTLFNPADGFLSGGLEAVAYPLKWRGLQVRGSIGVDLSRKMPWLKGKFNQDWRGSAKSYEISIGIGLHY